MNNIEELQKQYNEIQKIYFLKCKELSEIELALLEYKTMISAIQNDTKIKRKYSRIKLKNSKTLTKYSNKSQN